MLAFGIVTVSPGADHYGTVLVGSESRRCYFDPLRFVTPYLPTRSAKVVIQQARNEWKALQVIGVGAFV